MEPYTGDIAEVTSPIVDASTGSRTVIGRLSQMGEADAMLSLNAAVEAWDGGQGVWPQMSGEQRIQAVEAALVAMKDVREEIVKCLMWEICKNTGDAAKEFDRTMDCRTCLLPHRFHARMLSRTLLTLNVHCPLCAAQMLRLPSPSTASRMGRRSVSGLASAAPALVSAVDPSA